MEDRSNPGTAVRVLLPGFLDAFRAIRLPAGSTNGCLWTRFRTWRIGLRSRLPEIADEIYYRGLVRPPQLAASFYCPSKFQINASAMISIMHMMVRRLMQFHEACAIKAQPSRAGNSPYRLGLKQPEPLPIPAASAVRRVISPSPQCQRT